MGGAKHESALVEISAISPTFRRAVEKALNHLSLHRVDSLDVALGLTHQVVLLVGDGVDPVALFRRCVPGRRRHLLVACERAEGSEVARWARAGVTRCFVGTTSLVDLRADLLASEPPAVSLDASDLAIEIRGVRTRLTKTQFRLFQHLSARSGQWVTPSRLVKEVLGTNHANDSALVRVHIFAIRRKLGPLAPLIETDPARARGYRFREDLL